jgi:hypothetical protein
MREGVSHQILLSVLQRGSLSNDFPLLPSFLFTLRPIDFLRLIQFTFSTSLNSITMPPNIIPVSEWCYHHIVSPPIVFTHSVLISGSWYLRPYDW